MIKRRQFTSERTFQDSTNPRVRVRSRAFMCKFIVCRRSYGRYDWMTQVMGVSGAILTKHTRGLFRSIRRTNAQPVKKKIVPSKINVGDGISALLCVYEKVTRRQNRFRLWYFNIKWLKPKEQKLGRGGDQIFKSIDVTVVRLADVCYSALVLYENEFGYFMLVYNIKAQMLYYMIYIGVRTTIHALSASTVKFIVITHALSGCSVITNACTDLSVMTHA